MYAKIIAAGVVLGAMLGCAINAGRPAASPRDNAPKARAEARAQVLRHVVLFRFKAGTAAADIQKVEAAFCALPSKIPAIRDFEWGTDVGTEKLGDGFTHCFFLTFASEADRAAYLPHPAHQEFGKMLGPYLDKVLVLDYWAKE